MTIKQLLAFTAAAYATSYHCKTGENSLCDNMETNGINSLPLDCSLGSRATKGCREVKPDYLKAKKKINDVLKRCFNKEFFENTFSNNSLVAKGTVSECEGKLEEYHGWTVEYKFNHIKDCDLLKQKLDEQLNACIESNDHTTAIALGIGIPIVVIFACVTIALRLFPKQIFGFVDRCKEKCFPV